MGKRSRAKALAEGSASASENSSKQTSPVPSDSDDNDRSPPAKRTKSENGGKKVPKTSAELCEQYGLQDVELEYTVADYQNLTNYGLFVRMVRPQVAAANAKIASSRMVQLMEAKWREFRESNPLTKKRREDEDKKVTPEKPASEKKKKSKESAKKKKTPEKKIKSKPKKPLISSDEESNGDKTEEAASDREEDRDEEDEEEEVEPKRKPGIGLKIKLPLFSPKSSSAKKSKKDRRSGSSKKKSALGDSDEEESVNSSKRSSRVATPISRQQSDTNEESSAVEDLSEEEAPAKRSRAQPKRKSRGSRKVVQEDVSSAEEEDPATDDDYQSSSKKRSKPKSKPKREKVPVEDVDFDAEEDEEEEDEGDEDMDTDDEGRKKKSRGKPVIPGERKSERSRKSLNASLMSDREFEKMLKEEAAEKKRQEKDKKERSKKATKTKVVKGKKGYWQEDENDKDGENSKEGDESKEIDESDDHYWYCEVCKDGGDLLLCDTCPKSWHKDCAKMDGEVPDGEWSCPKCKGTYESEGEDDDHHDLYCKECKDGGDVLLCDFCRLVYHPKCINPPLIDIPEGEWKCPRCVVASTPLKGRIRRVLFWRWSHQLSSTDETDHTQSPQKKAAAQAAEAEQKEKEAHGETPVKRPERQFLVRFEFHSFWDVEWISELEFEVHAPIQHRNIRAKWDMQEPPVLEDGSSWGRQRRKTRTEDDPHNLEEKYYRYGVKPDWLQIHRIINHDGKEGKPNTRYLIKWRDLGYEDCTWETPSDKPDGLEDWDKKYKAYWEHRKEKLKPPKEKKKPKKSDLKKKWEKQPDYITSTGGTLHPYQLEGVNWMRFSWSQDTNIILADEMGLGKTIQAISILYTLWKEGYAKGPFLISAPLSTVPNWEREFEFWAPDMYVMTYVGSKEGRVVMREHEFSYDDDPFPTYTKAMRMRPSTRPKFDVLLTSYEMVNMDRTALASIEWDMLVVDEAHRLKSQQSLFFQTLTKYKLAYKLLLTGTPLQNNLEELFNLLNFLEPDKFKSMEEFLDEFSDINKDEQVTRLHEMLAPHMLRRLKLDVLTDLPTKSEFIVRIELAPMQKKFYKHILTKNYEALNVKGYANSTSLINIMMDLRKCCNHPYLFPAAEKEAPITQQGLYEGSALIKACGKLELLSKMLRQLRKDNHRVLIFSQMTRALDILEDFLSYMGYGYERIDGSITGKLRQESIDRFNNTESSTSFVFLLSTKAGGLGINLATADTVVIYDMDWNPHNDIQALSRAHRIGQKNRVLIYRFVSRNTVEERITETAKKKMMLTELVIHRGMGSEKQESLSKKEVNEILKFGAEELFKDNEEGSVVWTDDAINKLLDRTQEGDTPDAGQSEKEALMGMNEYLRSFKVASYHVKEGEEEVPEKEAEEEEPEEEEDQEEDNEYWRRVLGDAYQEHRMQLMQQQEAVERSLGKGKRVRRQVNYAEIVLTKESIREQQEKEAAKQKGKKADEPEPEEEQDHIEEEAKYMSDYEPGEDETSEEEEEEPEQPKSDADDEDWDVKDKDKSELKKRGRPPKNAKVQSNELPPLLAKVNGHTEVLGFTARQRRAFLDAVMRYGMPPEDGHQSQWLVRDLRNKVEKVFRAYVSLFMRHLCEAVTDNAEKFSDGVPREGLSRQHVLTRIGIIALIRRKVQEFEDRNGTDSLIEYKKRLANSVKNPIVIASNAKTESNDKTPDIKDAADTKGEEVKEENGEKPQEKTDEKDNTDEVKKEITDDKEPKTENGKAEDTAEVKEEKTKEEDVEKDKKEVKEEKEEAMEVDEEEKKKDEKTPSKADGDIPQVDGAGDDKDSPAADSEKEDKDKGGDQAEEKTSADKDGESSGEKEKSEEKIISEEKSEDKMEVDDKDKPDGDKKEAEDEKSAKSEDKEKKDEVEDKETKTESKEKKEDDKPKDGDKPKEDESKASAEKGKSEEQKVTATEKKPDVKTDKVKIDPRRLAWELRRIFYIADGGFTELHALWQYEEQQLKPGREYETWHRRHDYWLLAGIITHGYRHWQDILNDPRFGMLNRAFQSDAEKMRKAAFLNRRFQLLEQALVIEEQLHKAILQSPDLQAQLRKNCRGELDPYSELDQLAILLRQIARRGATQDPHLARVLAQLESLVGDIKHSTNSVVPATLARAPGVVIRQTTPQRAHQQHIRQIRPVQQVVLPRHVMEQQRRNTPSPISKGTTVITLD